MLEFRVCCFYWSDSRSRMIFNVQSKTKLMFFQQVVGTPTEESWQGVNRLPGLRTHVTRWGTCPGRPLGSAFPRLRDGGREAERLAAALLQPDPTRRLAAHSALYHAYFASLPPRLRDLPDGE